MSRTNVVELVPERLYVLGGAVRLGPEVSWAPRSAWGRWQTFNACLLTEGDRAMLVDPGPAWHEPVLREQLQEILAPGSPLSVFVTRSEFDSFGALGSVAELYDIDSLYAGGAHNPFDAFGFLTRVDGSRSTEMLPLARLAAGSTLAISEQRAVTVLRPLLRMLPTFWVYDEATRTLFTSDAFDQGTLAGPAESRVTTDPDDLSVDAVRDHLCTKLWWLPHAGANVRDIADDLDTIFERYPIDTVAPARGTVIHGRAACLALLEHVTQVFAAIAGTTTERGTA